MLVWLLVVAVCGLVDVASADGYPGYAGGSGYLNGYPGGYPGGHPGGYPGGAGGGGYPSGGSPGSHGNYPNYGINNYQVQVPRKQLTEVDKLFARLADVDSELHILTEGLSSAQARLVRAKRFTDELVTTTAETNNVDDTQNDELQALTDVLNSLEGALNTGATTLMMVDPVNAGNTQNLGVEGERLAMAAAADTAQQGELDRLTALIPRLKTRLLANTENSFMSLDLTITEERQRVRTVQALARSRQCETGTVTLYRDDRRAVVIFNANFGDDVPQILYGIAGYQLDLMARGASEAPSPSSRYGGSSGNGYLTEPNAVGVFVSASATPDSVTFQATNLGFGDSDLISVKINYQACNIGPDAFDV